jgi:hypothetical protein
MQVRQDWGCVQFLRLSDGYMGIYYTVLCMLGILFKEWEKKELWS